jgi:hypothetical protein
MNELAPYWSCFRFNGKLPSCTFLKGYKNNNGKNKNAINSTNSPIIVSENKSSPYALRRRNKGKQNKFLFAYFTDT